MEQRPPKTGRSRTGIPRAVVRKDNQPPGQAIAAPRRHVPAAPSRTAPTPPIPDDLLDSDDDAPTTIVARVAEPTLRYELAKRARPCTSSSSASDEQEDKRLRMSHGPALALPPPPEYVESPRSPSPPEHPPRQEVLLIPTHAHRALPTTQVRRHDTPVPLIADRPRRSPALPPSPSHDDEYASMPSRSDSAHSSARRYDSASWPKDSTSYAGLPSPRRDTHMMSPTPRTVQPPQPSSSYAAAAATPPNPHRAPAQAQRSPPLADAGVTNPPRPAPRSSYPPIVAERLPHWPERFIELERILGHAPNARPLRGGVRFLPKSAEEFRAIQRYLTDAASRDGDISWYCYSPATELPTKIAVRGLPYATPIEEIINAFCALGFPAEAARAIPPARGKHGCTYYVRLGHLTHDELRELYSITELLYMPGVIIEAWRGGNKPPQCFRCQTFGHSSARCHRQPRCVRCAGNHIVRDCQTSPDEPTCANCGQDHAANDRRCSFYKREVRRRGIKQFPPPPPRAPLPNQPRTARVPAPPAAQPAAQPTPQTPAPAPAAAVETPTATAAGATSQPAAGHDPTPHPEAPTTLAPPANNPTARDAPLRRKRRRRNRAPRPPHTEPTAASTPQPRPRREAAVPRSTTRPPARAPPQTTTDRTTRTNRRPSHQTAQAPPAPPPTQGEVRAIPDFMAFFRAVLEALTVGLNIYLQGQGAVQALIAGLAALTRFSQF